MPVTTPYLDGLLGDLNARRQQAAARRQQAARLIARRCRCGDVLGVDDRFSLSSSIYTSDLSACAPLQDDFESLMPWCNNDSDINAQKIIQPASDDMARLMQFDFGFGSA